MFPIPSPWPPLAADHPLVADFPIVLCPLCSGIFREGDRTCPGTRHPTDDPRLESVEVVHYNCARAFNVGFLAGRR